MNASDDSQPELPPASIDRQALRLQAGESPVRVEATLAEEVAVALVYNGIAHAVMMATPLDLADFALGFSLSEGILASPADLLGLEVEPGPSGITLQLRITARREVRLKERRRSLAGRTGCGLCGTDSLQEALRPVAAVPTGGWRLDPAAIEAAMAQLGRQQPLNQLTGATHAAAWCATDGRIELVREDIGRHNALDKLIGALVAQRPADGPRPPGFVVVTSRASFEMVHKCAGAGIELLAAVSAPTALAIRLAEQSGLTLLGYARGTRATIYAGEARLAVEPPSLE